jgi:hypothetical protein
MSFDDFHRPLFEWVFVGVDVGGGVAGVVTG